MLFYGKQKKQYSILPMIYIQFDPYSFNLTFIFIQFNPRFFSSIPIVILFHTFSFNSIFRSIQLNLCIYFIQFQYWFNLISVFIRFNFYFYDNCRERTIWQFVIVKNKWCQFLEFRHNIVKVVCGSTRLSPRGSTATLTAMLWRNSWSIPGYTHEKLTPIC